MGQFFGEFEGVYHSRRQCWEVKEKFSYYTGKDLIQIPVGLYSDLASVSIPGFRPDTFLSAAVLHDFLYSGEFVPRHIADRIFLQAILDTPKVPRWKARAAWLAVRAFGGFTYRAHHDDTIRYVRALAKVKDPIPTIRPLWPDGKLHFPVG